MHRFILWFTVCIGLASLGLHVSTSPLPASASPIVGSATVSLATISAIPAPLAPPVPPVASLSSVRQNPASGRCSTTAKRLSCSMFAGDRQPCSSTHAGLNCSLHAQVHCSTGVENLSQPALFCSAKAQGVCSAFVAATPGSGCSTVRFGGTCTAQGSQARCSAFAPGSFCSVLGGSPGTTRCEG